MERYWNADGTLLERIWNASSTSLEVCGTHLGAFGTNLRKYTRILEHLKVP